jgi:hypothetical protein
MRPDFFTLASLSVNIIYARLKIKNELLRLQPQRVLKTEGRAHPRPLKKSRVAFYGFR